MPANPTVSRQRNTPCFGADVCCRRRRVEPRRKLNRCPIASGRKVRSARGGPVERDRRHDRHDRHARHQRRNDCQALFFICDSLTALV